MFKAAKRIVPVVNVVAKQCRFRSKNKSLARSGYDPLGRGFQFPLEDLFSRSNDIMGLLDQDMIPFADTTMSFSANMNMDIRETDNSYELMVDVPGIEKKDIHLSANDGILTITAERHTVTDEQEARRMKRSERFSGRITRSMSLPQHVDAEKISAECNHGVLKITVPKTAEAEKVDQPKRIEIQ